MVLRLLLDVNVWVNHYHSLSRGREGSAEQQLVQAAFSGHCRLGPIQPIISHRMLDTLQDVLIRIDLPERFAEAARNAVEATATGGIVSKPLQMVLGAVFELAVAGGADLLVTNNVADFTPGPRADVDADVIRRNPGQQPDVVLFRYPTLPHDLIIASVFAARSWLHDGARPPPGVLSRFLPNEPATPPR